jgi:hypothetical protein
MQRADVENVTLFVDGTTLLGEVDRYINESVKMWWNMIHQYGSTPFNMKIASFALTGLTSTSFYTLSPDFYQMRRVELTEGNNHVELEPVGLHSMRAADGDRDRLNRFDRCPKYFLYSDVDTISGQVQKMLITPRSTVGTLQYYYVPEAPDLSLAGSVIPSFNGWDEWVVIDAAMKILEKEESEVRDLRVRRDTLGRAIISQVMARDASWHSNVEIVQTFREYGY